MRNSGFPNIDEEFKDMVDFDKERLRLKTLPRQVRQ